MTFSSKRPTWRHNNESALVKMILSDSISSGTQFVIEHAWFLRRRLHKIYFSFLFKLKKKPSNLHIPGQDWTPTSLQPLLHLGIVQILFSSILSFLEWNGSWTHLDRSRLGFLHCLPHCCHQVFRAPNESFSGFQISLWIWKIWRKTFRFTDKFMGHSDEKRAPHPL